MEIKDNIKFLCTKIENELYVYQDYPSVVLIETTIDLMNLIQSASIERKKQTEQIGRAHV